MAPPGRLLAAAALVAMIGTGCSNAPAETGSGGGEKPVTGGSPSTAPVPTTAGGTGGGGDQNASQPGLVEERREFANCVRENGVEDFPDPDPNGAIVYYGDDPDLPTASEKCDPLQPGDGSRVPGNGG
jgi:hypothetical protein